MIRSGKFWGQIMDSYNWRGWSTSDTLWEKLKPLAREKRHDSTPAEGILWKYLRGRSLEGKKFRRQHTIERFIVDFFCAEQKLVIEVDGDIHQYTVVEDALRQEFLEQQGLRVIRFTNDEVLYSIETVLTKIREVLPSNGS
jgi:very-short-patch-repair endonuclease